MSRSRILESGCQKHKVGRPKNAITVNSCVDIHVIMAIDRQIC